ncbi:hypothetical protein ABH930_006390 [Kitasatospora sp. GAS204A]|uniref:hypothetical protein n=1 Tax=unclassified Kitasatospora TaxID=2633591 RepID=UPI0024743C41|nr:hypothetical protein [Kitasatospora sp. GAS204B]MDH6122018.1 hypothetical protein [Kitasatospora sp. GAS204B]
MTDHRECCPTVTAALDAHDAGDTQLALRLMDKARISGTPYEQSLVRATDQIVTARAALANSQH